MNQSYQGYFRSPTVHQDQVVFICEDDLWHISINAGTVKHLTNSQGVISTPSFSPDGQWLACCGNEEGNDDVYLLPSKGGPLQRLTYINASMKVVGWSPNGNHVIFWSNHQSTHHNADSWLYTVPIAGGPIQKLPYGPAHYIDYDPTQKGILLGRNAAQNFRWKRYRGGMIGEIWIKLPNKRQFTRILQDLPGNPVCPFWINERIYFVSDHEGIGNLYSSQTNGKEIRQETFQNEYYVRSPSTDGQTIVYHAGGKLFKLDLSSNQEKQIEVDWNGSRTQTQRKFFYGDEYLEHATIHPGGHMVALTTRGTMFSMPLWEQAVVQHGRGSGTRSRLTQWLPDGRLAAIYDQDKEAEKLGIFPAHPQLEPELLFDLPSGRVQHMLSAPHKNLLAFTTSRMELYLLDIDTQQTINLDTSSIREIRDITFSPDGNWLAYSKHLALELTAIFLANLNTQEIHQITQPIRYDFAPAFDPDGQYLYFLSCRTYNPIPDTVQSAVTFSRSIKPYLITLRKDSPNPFLLKPHAPGKHKEEEEKIEDDKKDSKEKKHPQKMTIDLPDIQQRILEFPVPEGLYKQIKGLFHKVLFTEYPLTGVLEEQYDNIEDKETGILWCYDFEKQEIEEQAREVFWIETTPAPHTLLYFSKGQIRVVEAGIPVPEERDVGDDMNRKTGWLDLSRVRISVNYAAEWKQMFREAWRLQKEFFWRKDLSGVDWEKMYKRYAPLVQHIGSRSELSDLIWEMQGELGTSHAYEYGGDYHQSLPYWVGRLGADLKYDNRRKHYIFHRIYQGDVWKKNEHSPLCEPGVQIQEGDSLLAIGGVPVDRDTPPDQLLAHQAEQEVLISVKRSKKNAKVQHIVVKTLSNDQRTRYREWVNQNSRIVSKMTDNQVGYLHIPDMQARGIAEFHRGFLSQTNKQGLIIDVRFNAGGMVSPLILEKLAHRHLGYDVPRRGAPTSYPYHTLYGHLIVLANEFTGSDGDMFCHSFKALKLGKIIGKRTWGGVIGIDSRYHLVDDTTTTQPQYSAWFHDAGWSLENHGVDPDIEVEFPPQAYAKYQDPQLEQGIQEMLILLEKEPLPASNIEF